MEGWYVCRALNDVAVVGGGYLSRGFRVSWLLGWVGLWFVEGLVVAVGFACR